jgi:hypothetical protein
MWGRHHQGLLFRSIAKFTQIHHHSWFVDPNSCLLAPSMMSCHRWAGRGGTSTGWAWTCARKAGHLGDQRTCSGNVDLHRHECCTFDGYVVLLLFHMQLL